VLIDVPTIDQLAALPPGIWTSAVVADPVRGDAFTWMRDSTSLSSAVLGLVAADVGRGIYVPPTVDPTGASGYWKRARSDGAVKGRWWGIVGDGDPVIDPWSLQGIGPVVGNGTDNGANFVRMAYWARAKSALNPDCAVEINPGRGVVYWNGSSTPKSGSTNFLDYAYAWTSGITNLTIDGKRAVTLQNIYREDVSGNNSAFSTCAPLNMTGMKGYLIQQTVPGSNLFTFINAADSARVSPGMVVVGCSEDGQYLGAPPNIKNLEFWTIKSVSGPQVTIVEKVQYMHRTDFPDFNLTPPGNCGAARVWIPTAQDWNGTNIYKGWQINKTPGLVVSQPYATLNKLSIVTEDWYGCGFSETQCREFHHIRPRLRTSPEMDKMLGSGIYDDLQGPVGISIQSATPNRLLVRGGDFAGITGCARQMHVIGARIGEFTPAAVFGYSISTRLESCDIQTCVPTAVGNVTDGAMLVALDGVNAQFVPPGNFVLNCSALGLAGLLNKWNVVPGGQINLQAATGLGPMYSNDLGAGYVVGSTWDGANTITIQTTLNFPNGLPSWATGSVYLFKVQELVAVSCTGNDVIRQMSDAAAHNERYFEYRRFPIAGVAAGSMSIDNPSGALLTEVTVDIKQPHATPTATMALIINTVQTPSMALDAGGVNIRTQLGAIGKRTWTLAGNTGINPGGATLDQITVGGAPASAIPTSRLVGPTTGVQLFTTPTNPSGAPIGEVLIKFSAGVARRPVTRQFDDSGLVTSAHTLFAAQSLVL
jgi:hypothetical protein